MFAYGLDDRSEFLGGSAGGSAHAAGGDELEGAKRK